MESGIRLFYVVFPDHDTAEKICRQLVEETLIACANIFQPHTAIYPWKGKIEVSPEVGAWLKTNASQSKLMQQRFLELHPYEVACCLEVSLGEVNTEYANWLHSQLPGSF